MRNETSKNGKIRVFFAIPCGDFFKLQHQIIKTVCDAANVREIIIEDHSQTDNLWDQITEQIRSADYFIADISSKSTNIALELGYAIREKGLGHCAVFISENIPDPVDVRGFKLQKYSSLKDFKAKLVKWFIDNISSVKAKKLKSLAKKERDFREDFKDYESLRQSWSFPSQCFYHLTHEGLHFANTNFPIMTNHLGLLRNYDFEFKARIEKLSVGWIVQGTRSFQKRGPVFCVMFNINQEGLLTPHILNEDIIDPEHLYNRFLDRQVKRNAGFTKEEWFTVTTRVLNDNISIMINGDPIFNTDFLHDERYKKYYEFPDKQGEVGFRCHSVEEATINYVKVTEL